MTRRHLRSALAATAVALASLAAVPAEADPAATATTPAAAASAARAAAPPVTLWAPRKQTAYAYRGKAYADLGLRLIAQGEPFELWATRSSYDAGIRTVWRSESRGDVVLPAGSMRRFDGLQDFVTLTFEKKGTKAITDTRDVCLGEITERVRPDATALSPYPRSCVYNPYSLGSVQGVQEGWATSLLGYGKPYKLAKGSYTVTARIAPRYATVLGLSAAQATRTMKLVVKDEPRPGPGPVDRTSALRPAAQPPTGRAGAPADGPVPDLRSLPAWGIGMARNGNFLQFSATVWNAGDSPLVVDGFRREGEDEMEAYQYFFDADGEQTGYQEVGHMHWDAKPTHQHWHFKDFATYTLLRADKTEVVTSKKEAFCLANTDAVDLTVPDADWMIESDDLATACGDYSSLSIREVLASGWGDTYAQFRAGQSFDLRGLKNGTYWIAVVANPRHRLVEASTANNVALRKVVIGGKPGKRTVKVPQVGIIKEPKRYGGRG